MAGGRELQEKNYGKWRANTGRNKKIESPEALWALAEGYFRHIDENPHFRKEAIKGGWLAGTAFEIEAYRPYTWMGFENYVFREIGLTTLEDYKTNREGRYNDFVDVIRVVERIIYDQKIDGAMMGHFQHNIVAMELGLSLKTENKVTIEQPLFPEPEDQADQIDE